MGPETIAIIVSSVAAVFAAVVGYVGKKALDRETARKVEAETASVYIENAEKLVLLMQERVDKMRDELNLLQLALAKHQEDLSKAIATETATQREVIKLRQRIVALEKYIKQHGLDLPVLETIE